MPIDENILCCPKCKGNVYYTQEKDYIICDACKLKYRLEEDIPVMLIDEAESFEKE